jgi:hypothetical protein
VGNLLLRDCYARTRSRLRSGEVAVLPDGLEVEVKGHTQKRSLGGDPRKETADLEVRDGARADRIALAHVIEPGKSPQAPKETWQQRAWQQYELALVGIKPGVETTLRVLRHAP